MPRHIIVHNTHTHSIDLTANSNDCSLCVNMSCAVRPQLIPVCIQAGTAVGIGLFTSLVGAIEIGLVVTGQYTLVEMGEITPEIVISICGLIIAAIGLHYHIKGSFCIALIFGTLVWWIHKDAWPDTVVKSPEVDFYKFTHEHISDIVLLTCDLIFLYILTLSGLVSSFSYLAGLVREDGTTPRNKWVFIMCGVTTVLSGLGSGPPILLSPESAAGIKAGARTGLSTCVCGLLFCLSVFFSPIFEAVPNAGTAPLLMLIGVILFQNVKRVDWNVITESVPAFSCLFFIPLTYSIVQGVVLGYITYIIINLFTGDLYYNALDFFGLPPPPGVGGSEVHGSNTINSPLNPKADISRLSVITLNYEPYSSPRNAHHESHAIPPNTNAHHESLHSARSDDQTTQVQSPPTSIQPFHEGTSMNVD